MPGRWGITPRGGIVRHARCANSSSGLLRVASSHRPRYPGGGGEATLEIRQGDRAVMSDSFECAIHRMAPTCEQSGCRVIGHGVEQGSRMFSGANCAAMAGISGKAVDV